MEQAGFYMESKTQQRAATGSAGTKLAASVALCEGRTLQTEHTSASAVQLPYVRAM